MISSVNGYRVSINLRSPATKQGTLERVYIGVSSCTDRPAVYLYIEAPNGNKG